jgi:hypothetical protein
MTLFSFEIKLPEMMGSLSPKLANYALNELARAQKVNRLMLTFPFASTGCLGAFLLKKPLFKKLTTDYKKQTYGLLFLIFVVQAYPFFSEYRTLSAFHRRYFDELTRIANQGG